MKAVGRIPKRYFWLPFWLAALLPCLASLPLRLLAVEPVDYSRQIKPIFRERCFACHGALRQQSALRLDSGDSIRRGGDSGPALVPGNVDASLIVQRITSSDKDQRMPPEGEPLSPAQITSIKSWIALGAPSPADETPDADPRKHWAFLPPVAAPVPTPSTIDWPLNPVDSFVAGARDLRSLSPLPDASRSTLLRRVYLDLIGIPPNRDEVREFIATEAPDAYEQVVDRLLASPQHGERWARHWMDVWRYSDWYGRRAVPDVMNSYPMIWRWRDWIVRSLNDDRGYDWMLQQMLAADELDPANEANLPATGFIVRNWFKWNYNTWMKDQVEHTSKAFLGLTVNCCHCHDHKYDPLTQEEYFKFRAFFEPLELRHDRMPGESDPGPFKKYVYAQSYGPIQSGLVRVFDEQLDAQTFMYSKGDHRLKIEGRPAIEPGVPAALGGDRFRIEPIELPPSAYYPGLQPFVQEEERAKRRAALDGAQSALVTARAEFEKSRETLSREIVEAEQRLATARQEALAAGSVVTDVSSRAPLGGDQSLALDAALGRRAIANRLDKLTDLGEGVVVIYKVAILKDGHTNFQLALDIDKGATGIYVGFENGKIQTYAPGGFQVIEPGKYDLVAGQNRFSVTLALDLPGNACRVSVTSLHDHRTLVDAVPAALNGWRPEPNGKRGIFLDARPGTIALYDDIRIGLAGAAPAVSFDFEVPTQVESQDIVGHDGWMNTSSSAAPATSLAVSAASLDERVAQAAKQLRGIRLKQDMAQRTLAAAETSLAAAQADLACIDARTAADNFRYAARQLPPPESRDPAAPNTTEDWIKNAVKAEQQFGLALADARLVDAERAEAVAEAAALAAPDKPAADKALAVLTAAQQKAFAARTAKNAAQTSAIQLPADYTPLSPKYPPRSTGRRAALARWITSDENPLTPRVAVNHVWLRHFGRALVETTFDFGRNGKPPSHPELLDWLAVEFQRATAGSPRNTDALGSIPTASDSASPSTGWSMKSLHRMLVTSRTYRQRSSLGSPTHPSLAADPDNRWLWRFSPARMQAETVRDSLLQVAGDLDAQLGGHEIDAAQGLVSRRRSLYFAHHGEGKMEFLELFDAPNPSDCYQRSASVQPQQALALANSELTRRIAHTFATRLWSELESATKQVEIQSPPVLIRETDFISAVFEQVLSRGPTAEELAASEAFLRDQTVLLAASPSPAQRARENLVHALLNHNDFLTIR